MKIGFVTDSPADIPTALVAQYGIEIIPSILVIDGKDLLDGKDITREDFYTRLPGFKRAPTTAATSPTPTMIA